MRRQLRHKPRISGLMFRWFSRYTRWYLRRHFHGVRVVRDWLPQELNGAPVIVCLNHPGWWDPLIAIHLANATFDRRLHYGPIDTAALARYQFFEKLGFFGVEAQSIRGTARFLQVAQLICADPRSVLWITPEGAFTDPRKRPVTIRSGAGHLVHALKDVWILPLALEYPFWEERRPEALACWGEPLYVTDGSEHSPAEWTLRIAGAMEASLNRLAELSSGRDRTAFNVSLAGSSGVGGIYDLWRRGKAWVHGQTFVPQHGSEEF